MQKRLILLTSITAAALLTGCSGKMTKENLISEMSAAAEGKTLSELVMDMDMDMSISTQGFSLSIAMDMDIASKFHAEAKEAYLDIDMSYEMFGETVEEAMEMFFIPEGDDYIAYTYTESTDTWEKSTYDNVFEMLETSNSDTSDSFELLNKATLAKDKETIDGTEVYVLNYTLDGETIKEVYEASDMYAKIKDALDELSEDDDLSTLFNLDLTTLEIPITMYVDAASYLPVQMDMDLNGLDTLLAPLFDEIMLLTDTDTDFQLSFDTMHISLKDLSYDAPEMPELPEEALMASEESDDEEEFGYEEAFDPIIAAGESYTVSEDDVSVEITPPVGWYVYPADDTLDFTMYNNEDSTMYFTCSIFTDSSEDDIEDYIDELIDIFKDSEYYGGHGFADAHSSMDCAWISYDNGMLYMIWYEISPSNYVFMEYDDYTGQDLDAIMNQVESFLGTPTV